MLGSDTAKRDIILVALGLLTALFSYWIFSEIHPLTVADNSLEQVQLEQRSSSILTNLGYQPTGSSITDFRVQSVMLDSLQKRGHLREIYTDSIRTTYPVFNWVAQREISIEDYIGRLSGITETTDQLNITLSEKGEFIGLENPSNVFPSRLVEPGLLERVIPSIQPHLSDIRADTAILKRIKFQFDPEPNTDVQNNFDPEGGNYLGRNIALQFGGHHLASSGWKADQFEVAEVNLVSINRVDIAQIIYETEVHEIDRSINVIVEVLPTGSLFSMKYEDPDVRSAEEAFADIQQDAQGVVYVVFIVWVMFLLFIRIRLRLIDTKLAVLFAVLAGFAFPAMILLEWTHGVFYSFEPLQSRDFFIQLFQTGIAAAFISLIYFAVTAVGDSITREHWPSKLRTFDLIRVGHLYNRPVGLVLIRAVAYSCILTAIYALSIYLLPESYVAVSETFRSNSSFLPFIEALITAFLIFFIVTQGILLTLVGKLSSHTKSGLLIGIFTAVAFVLFGPLPIRTGSFSTELIAVGAVGFSVGWIYVKEDYLTAFIAMTFLGLQLLSVKGWVMPNSPDASIFYITIILIFSALVFAVQAIRKGKSIRELPKFVPDYITDLAKDERVKQELQIARKVQQSFLPDQTPDIEGLDIAAVCNPAYETGGDYYDFIELNDGRLAVTIGDVSGKGIEAAFYMTFTKGVLHALCTDYTSTIEILSKFNSLFRKNARKGTFISLIFGLIDIENKEFRFSRAGHNPLLYFNSKQNTLNEYRPDGIGLGMASEDVFRKNICESTIKFQSDDILVLFTDGVVEATNRLNKYYGDDRLHKLIKQNKNLPAEKILQKLTDDLVKFGDGADQHDDMTVLVIKMK
ncbi:MAG: PP2C family protein-serine/threonine phosphatase [Balneolaceae bacterium]